MNEVVYETQWYAPFQSPRTLVWPAIADFKILIFQDFNIDLIHHK